MKITETITTTALAMISSFVLMSCQVAEVAEMEQPQHDQECLTGAVINLTSDESVSTKTEWNGYTIHWSQGDAISMTYCLSGQWGSRFYTSDPLARSSAFAAFSVPTDLEPTAAGQFSFYALSPSDAVTGDMDSAPVVTVNVPKQQTPAANSYDRNADLMVAHSKDEYSGVPEKPVKLLWNRLVAHAEITVSSLYLQDDETLKSVTLSVDENLAIAGEFSYDLATSKITPTNNASNSIKIDASSLSVDAAGNLKVWAAFMPCRISTLSVSVETSANTYIRVINDCNLDFARNKRNVLDVKMSGIPSYPMVIAHRGCWFKNDIPEHSLAAVRMAKRFGYKAVEIDVRETSDGVMMVLHDQTLKRTMRNASDYSTLTDDVAIADLTYEQVRSGYVMASDNPEYREPMRTLEEILNECKKYGLMAMMHTSTWNAYRMAHQILGDGNWIAFHSKETALNFARNTLGMTGLILYSVGAGTPVADIDAQYANLGGPFGISTMDTDLLSAEYNASLKDKGYAVQASVFDAPYEWQATHNGVTHHLTNFVVMPDQKMKVVDTIRGSAFQLISGQSVSKKWSTMEYGATVLRIKFVGSLTVVVNGTTYDMTSDGSQEEVIGKRFHAGAPSFSITAAGDADIEYYEVSLKEPDDLVL